MKIGMKFILNGFDCVVCDQKDIGGNEYVNVRLRKDDKTDYKIMKVVKDNNNFKLMEVNNSDELVKILPEFLTDEID